MTTTHSNTVCSHLLSYLLGHLNEEERERFEEHLPECADCRQEIAEWQPAFDMLPYSSEILQPPAELKHKVLQSAYQAKAPVGKQGQSVEMLAAKRTEIPLANSTQTSSVTPIASPSSSLSAWSQFLSNVYGKLSLGLIAVLLFAFGTSVWYANVMSNRLSQAQPAPDMNVERSLALYPTADNPQGTGTAYLVHTPEGMQIVVQVANAKQLTDDQAYQVWLLKNGERQNAGTFRVDNRGSGILIYSFGNRKPDFDSIGITREPDPYGTSPRGPKVLGSQLL